MDQISDLKSSSINFFEIFLWIKSVILAEIIFGFFLVYVFLIDFSVSLKSIGSAIAASASIMIGLSFALSGICYFFDFLDREFYYRKYFGLVGYFLALFYSVLLLFIDPQRYFYGFFDNLLSLDVILGLSAMTIFTMMAIISNKTAMILLKPQNWRALLRLGYLAYGLLVIRAAVLEKDLWLAWWKQHNSLPPVRLVISVFAVMVILLRISIKISKLIKMATRQPISPKPIANNKI